MVRLYSKTFDLPPLAAKIYAYLIFDFDRHGLAFDDLVEALSASKSSVSTNLNLLLSNNLVQDINKLEERKRYFVVNDNFIKLRFGEIVSRLKEELNIVKALDRFNENRSNSVKERNKIYQDLLEKNIDNIEQSLSKL